MITLVKAMFKVCLPFDILNRYSHKYIYTTECSQCGVTLHHSQIEGGIYQSNPFILTKEGKAIELIHHPVVCLCGNQLDDGEAYGV